MKLTKKTKLREVLEINGSEEVLARFSVPCLHCPMARFEADKLNLETICKLYGIDLEKLLKELNELNKL